MAVRAVTFDYWNTLVREGSGYPELRASAVHRVLTDLGLEVDRAGLDPLLEAITRDRVEAWVGGRHLDAGHAVDRLLAEPGWSQAAPGRDRLVSAFADPDPGHLPPLTPGVGDALERLKAAGCHIGIVCDVGFTPSRVLRRTLETHGVLRYFDHWSFSDEVGVFKPDPMIFRHALAGLGADAAHTAHVGDLRRTDVAGARALGLVAVRYAGAFDDPGRADDGTDRIEADHVVHDHADLAATLGLG